MQGTSTRRPEHIVTAAATAAATAVAVEATAPFGAWREIDRVFYVVIAI